MSGQRRTVPLPSPDRVRAVIRYDGEHFYWLPRPLSFFSKFGYWRSWTTRYADKRVSIKRQLNGYHGIRVDKALILLHRLVWVLHYGEWPKGELDHIDGDRTNNAIDNLRDVSKSENMRNQVVRSDSTSGCPGVHFCKSKRHRPWVARVGINNTWKTLGYFATREEAIECRLREQVNYGFTARHGRETRQQVLTP